MDASVQELLDLEWQLFDEAPLAGRRSARPEDREFFTIARSSQLSSWTPELRASWRRDLQTASAEGRNLINEKYIYMLERTDLKRYDALKDKLPAASMEKLWLVDWICHAQVAWQEALKEKYPTITQNGRAVRRSQDSEEEVSYETYLRGELMVCSVNTLRLYASKVEHAQKADENLCETVLENTLQQFGFDSLDAAEERIFQR